MSRALALLSSALALVAAAPEVHGFSAVAVGDPIEDVEMAALDGGRQPLLGKARASVFVFFRPEQDHSLELLRRLARMEKDFAAKPVRFAGVVSDGFPPERVRALVKEAGVRMPVLVDRGDALYGKLGVRLHPVVGIADARHRLAAYVHFRRVNMEEILRAHIRFVLGEISEAEVARAEAPPRAAMPNDDARQVARRDLNLGRMLLERRNFEKALAAARKAQERDPGLAAARTLAGQALARMGRCAEAAAEFRAALDLDPGEAAAAEGMRACAGK